MTISSSIPSILVEAHHPAQLSPRTLAGAFLVVLLVVLVLAIGLGRQAMFRAPPASIGAMPVLLDLAPLPAPTVVPVPVPRPGPETVPETSPVPPAQRVDSLPAPAKRSARVPAPTAAATPRPQKPRPMASARPATPAPHFDRYPRAQRAAAAAFVGRITAIARFCGSPIGNSFDRIIRGSTRIDPADRASYLRAANAAPNQQSIANVGGCAAIVADTARRRGDVMAYLHLLGL